tara:strand:- start:794 stop:1327 length:534 start_codon:yes stop_codon:yes gene_type:complete
MATQHFSSIGGFAVGATEVLDTANALKNISAMHMVSDQFSDANKDVYIMKRTTDSVTNVSQLTLTGSTALSTTVPALPNNTVSFISARVFGQETTTNTYVFASQHEVIVTVDGSGVPTLAANFQNVIKETVPGQETWSVTPDPFQIGSDAYFTFEVSSVTSSSTVKWVGILDITIVS